MPLLGAVAPLLLLRDPDDDASAASDGVEDDDAAASSLSLPVGVTRTFGVSIRGLSASSMNEERPFLSGSTSSIGSGASVGGAAASLGLRGAGKSASVGLGRPEYAPSTELLPGASAWGELERVLEECSEKPTDP